MSYETWSELIQRSQTAHDPFGRLGVEGKMQSFHIFFIMMGAYQICLKAVNGHIGQGIEMIKLDAKSTF